MTGTSDICMEESHGAIAHSTTPSNTSFEGVDDTGGGELSDDPVVHEMPVYLSKALMKNLFIFQYPMRPANSSHDYTTVVDSKYKSSSNVFQLSMGLDTFSKNFDTSKAEQIAVNTGVGSEGGGSNKLFKGLTGSKLISKQEEAIFSSGLMDKTTLVSNPVYSSQKRECDVNRYAIGVLSGDGGLHLTPLTNPLICFKSDRTYLDKADQMSKKRSSSKGGTGDDSCDEMGNAEEDEEEELKAVTVKFANAKVASNNKTTVSKKNQYETYKSKLDQEQWISSRLNVQGSESSASEIQKLYCSTLDGDGGVAVSDMGDEVKKSERKWRVSKSHYEYLNLLSNAMNSTFTYSNKGTT